MRRLLWAGLLGALALVGACSSDDINAGNVEDKLVEQLQSGDGFDEDTARCIAAAVKEDIGADRLAELYAPDPDRLPDEVENSVRQETPACFDLGSVVESIPR
jgi:hypothetical protein